MEMNGLSACLCVLLLGVSASLAGNAILHPAIGGRSLVIKAFPAIENYQSPLFEVYGEPYRFVVTHRQGKNHQDLHSVTAVAVLQGEGESDVKGEIMFTQSHPPAGPVLIQGNITGLPEGEHGVHIHQAGDLRQGCDKLGGHFNPYLFQHGGQTDPIRHIGDLGNIVPDDGGVAELNVTDPLISLSAGPRGVVGRAIVITQNADDLGRGGNADSLVTGNSGAPIACGVIAYIR